jgi:hypothetical protein
MPPQMDPIIQFWNICNQATRSLEETYCASGVIPYGTKVLELIEKNENMRSDFVEAFLEGLEKPDVCDKWLIQFCMHALRWPEAKEKFEESSRKAIEQNNWNRIQPLRHILESFEDDWEDAGDIYAEYFARKNI